MEGYEPSVLSATSPKRQPLPGGASGGKQNRRQQAKAGRDKGQALSPDGKMLRGRKGHQGEQRDKRREEEGDDDHGDDDDEAEREEEEVITPPRRKQRFKGAKSVLRLFSRSRSRSPAKSAGKKSKRRSPSADAVQSSGATGARDASPAVAMRAHKRDREERRQRSQSAHAAAPHTGRGGDDERDGEGACSSAESEGELDDTGGALSDTSASSAAKLSWRQRRRQRKQQRKAEKEERKEKQKQRQEQALEELRRRRQQREQSQLQPQHQGSAHDGHSHPSSHDGSDGGSGAGAVGRDVVDVDAHVSREEPQQSGAPTQSARTQHRDDDGQQQRRGRKIEAGDSLSVPSSPATKKVGLVCSAP